ncbi:hypothetical protein BD413DRAFT_70755 [Trametes elegans]|nr:hypothetical protein BD413DRAFT_70755 [Trametes elegans]
MALMEKAERLSRCGGGPLLVNLYAVRRPPPKDVEGSRCASRVHACCLSYCNSRAIESPCQAWPCFRSTAKGTSGNLGLAAGPRVGACYDRERLGRKPGRTPDPHPGRRVSRELVCRASTDPGEAAGWRRLSLPGAWRRWRRFRENNIPPIQT